MNISARCLFIVLMVTKKRQPRNKALAEMIRDRLEIVRRDRGLNYTEFASAAGVPRSQYNAWRNSGVVPGGYYLRCMAERLGVSTDWLLCIEGAPIFQGIRGTPEEQEAEVLAHLARGLSHVLQLGVGEVTVDGRAIDNPILRLMVRTFLERVQEDTDQLVSSALKSMQAGEITPERQRVLDAMLRLESREPSNLHHKAKDPRP